jgi:ubiquitin carboxyl-terminal hydrolase L3
MIPKPVLGIMMLYEESPAQTAFKNAEADTLKPEEVGQNVFYMKQHAMNACGSIALFHIILNAREKYPDIVIPDSFLDKFSQRASDKDSEARAQIFKNSEEIQNEHKQAVNEGQSSVQRDCNAHFISFVPKNGRIYELDGFKKCPVDHGACT